MTEQRNKKEGGNTQNEKRTDLREPTNTTGATWGNYIPTNLRKLIKDRGRIASVLADGHCLFRAVWKYYA